MSKRYICFVLSVVLLFVTIIGRLGYLMFSNDFSVNSGYNSYSIILDTDDKNIYFSNGTRLTNNKTSYIAIIRPNSKCISELSKIFTQSDITNIINELKKGFPIAKEIDKKYNTKYITIYEINKTNITLSHFVSKESSGLLSYNDEKRELKLNFSVDAMGRMLQGDKGKIDNNEYNTREGLLSTFDERVQGIVNESSANLHSGTVIVMSCKNGKILASSNNPSNSYINKSISQYSVGSVYKLVVAVCALENNINVDYTCSGSIKVNDLTFNCQKNNSHGKQDLKNALANSCNCYFVNLIQILGSEKILETSRKLGFNSQTELYNKWIVDNANMPSEDELKSIGELSLLGFGQGKLTASPMQICSALCTISDGYYKAPSIIDGTVNKKGLRIKDKIKPNNRVLNSFTVSKMREYMRYVVTNGTAVNAESQKGLSCGKTATAETGQYVFYRQKYNTWFAGLYPYNNPKYAIVIMCEDGKSGAEDCCPIFRTIVDKLDEM